MDCEVLVFAVIPQLQSQRRAGMKSGISTAIAPVSQENFLQNQANRKVFLKFRYFSAFAATCAKLFPNRTA
jgi:hypothetical protein